MHAPTSSFAGRAVTVAPRLSSSLKRRRLNKFRFLPVSERASCELGARMAWRGCGVRSAVGGRGRDRRRRVKPSAQGAELDRGWTIGEGGGGEQRRNEENHLGEVCTRRRPLSHSLLGGCHTASLAVLGQRDYCARERGREREALGFVMSSPHAAYKAAIQWRDAQLTQAPRPTGRMAKRVSQLS